MALSSAAKEKAKPLVTELIQVCESSELKEKLSPEAEARAIELASQLEQIGKDEDWLSDSTFIDSYQCIFQEEGKRTPIGGFFRGSPLGRLLFRTEEVYNVLQEPDRVTNSLFFNFLGVIPGSVSLTGRFDRVPAEERQALSDKYKPSRAITANTLKLTLGAPLVRFGKSGVVNLDFGPANTAILDTVYLDDRLRVSRSARFGNYIVLVRIRASSPSYTRANAFQTPPPTPKLPPAVGAAYALGGLVLLFRPDFLLADGGSAPIPRRAAIGLGLLLLPPSLLLLLAPL